MQNQSNTKLSTWLLWAPLKFALITFAAISMMGILYSIIYGAIFPQNPIPQRPILGLSAIALVLSILYMIKKLPHKKMDHNSFVAIHNAQITITSLAFIISSYLIIYSIDKIMFKLMLMNTQSTLTFVLTTALITIFLLYIFGLLIANIFAKFCRIQVFNISTWKIFMCMPFTFSALWIPGYILQSQKKESASININTKWYKRINEIILSHPAYTISAFIIVTLLSGFLFGLNAILLTFILSLIFGIWALQIGTKKFIKNLNGKYTTIAIIINIILITITSIVIFMPKTIQTVQINISDTQTVMHQEGTIK